MLLVAAFQTLLYRYTAQDDVLIGTVLAGRDLIETEGIIGLFASTHILRTDLSGDPTFKQLLARVREVVVGMHTHRSIPLKTLVEELRPERTLSHTPLFQVMFVFQNTTQEKLELAGLSLNFFEVESTITKFDLTLLMTEGTNGLSGAIQYNTDLFDASTIARMVSHLLVMLEAIACDPQQRICFLPLLGPSERHELLIEWNNTKTSYRQDKCIHDLFDEQAESSADAVALIYEDEQVTYEGLKRRANQLAHHLRRLGVGPEVLVGICLDRSTEMIVGLLGVLKAGGAYVPLDPAYPKQRLKYMLEDS